MSPHQSMNLCIEFDKSYTMYLLFILVANTFGLQNPSPNQLTLKTDCKKDGLIYLKNYLFSLCFQKVHEVKAV